ncbi:MAG: MFS transporter [Gammaproteobacteria bacterium]|nr:MFS transporter [Gammaproteobacteria bacterium]
MSAPHNGDSGANSGTWRELFEGDRLPRFVVLCLGLWLHAASSMLAATTLPRAVIDIGGHQLIGWAFSLYQLGSILAGAATALMVARVGLRSALLGAASVYGLGCCVCALAPEMPTLLGGRLLQGLGGGALVALNYVGLSRLFPSALLPRLIALTSAI